MTVMRRGLAFIVPAALAMPLSHEQTKALASHSQVALQHCEGAILPLARAKARAAAAAKEQVQLDAHEVMYDPSAYPGAPRRRTHARHARGSGARGPNARLEGEESRSA